MLHQPFKEMEMELAGRKLVLQTGKMAKQANASVVAKYGDSMVLATATASRKPSEDIDYFPLVVDFVEKMYAAGKVPGGFYKREARPSTEAILSARLIDRPLRPLFPDGFHNEVQIVVTVLSYDEQNSPDMIGMIAASAALTISDIPFNGPIAGVTVGLIDNEFVINPTVSQLKKSKLELDIAGTKNDVVMVEASAKEVSEDAILQAIEKALPVIRNIVEFQEKFAEGIAQEKMEIEQEIIQEELLTEVKEKIQDKLSLAYFIKNKKARNEKFNEIKEELLTEYESSLTDEEYAEKEKFLVSAYENIKRELIRRYLLYDHKRVDARGLDEIREISCEIDVLPRAHGSSLFTRGETQSLGTLTLGSTSDEQIVDGLQEEYKKQFYLHYNFPPFSVGEVRFLRAPGRRELGHGNLAEKALLPILPEQDKFPYTIRIVSEILESNGSSSMATVCSATLALMAGGVPIKKPVAGIANGLIKDGDNYIILTDIIGMEDHYGDMDFKVTGTKHGITALQMDIKIDGITTEIMKKALYKAKDARLFILNKILETIPQPRSDISTYAPRIETLKIPHEKIAEVIGPSGKTIKKIIEQTDVKIDIDDDGTTKIASPNKASIRKAMQMIEMLIEEPKVGKTYIGKVKNVRDFGAFVEFLPKKEGLVHVSNLEQKRTKNVRDVVKEGDEVMVKIIRIDDDGKVQLSMKDIRK
ncbi:MAG: polyribonucleotide nucleotidyltransferase [Candidatus Cloacimonadota bacterium]|nr:MAG: polyribonucleotide nucleotidyltransferase [Candidatus Cloacimonadota bacterium]